MTLSVLYLIYEFNNKKNVKQAINTNLSRSKVKMFITLIHYYFLSIRTVIYFII